MGELKALGGMDRALPNTVAGASHGDVLIPLHASLVVGILLLDKLSQLI